MKRMTAGKTLAKLLTAVVLAAACTTTTLAAEDRTKIEEVHLTISSSIVSGSSGGSVSITTSDSGYSVGDTEILNDDDDWVGGMRPKVEVDLYADSDHYFDSPGKSMFSFSGDDASYSSARREDNKSTIVLTLRLDKLDNGDLTVTGVEWDGESGNATWDENSSAKYYQVKLYRNDSTVGSTRTTYDNEYDFAGSITRKGDYYFEVRAVGSGSEKGEWESSDSWYVSSSEADDLSDGYHDGPGGSSSGSSGGPGVSGSSGNGGSGGSGGPGATGGSYGGPGVSGSSGSGASTNGTGHHWCLDQRGWWFQYAGGSYPVNCWQLIDSRWYCFGEDGYIRCGWIQWDGKWYYTDASGALLTNARTPDGCYVGGDGAWIQ